ncbi:MAG: hypothetical protein V7K55_16405 [Nostoc sp.]
MQQLKRDGLRTAGGDRIPVRLESNAWFCKTAIASNQQRRKML